MTPSPPLPRRVYSTSKLSRILWNARVTYPPHENGKLESLVQLTSFLGCKKAPLSALMLPYITNSSTAVSPKVYNAANASRYRSTKNDRIPRSVIPL